MLSNVMVTSNAMILEIPVLDENIEWSSSSSRQKVGRMEVLKYLELKEL